MTEFILLLSYFWSCISRNKSYVRALCLLLQKFCP